MYNYICTYMIEREREREREILHVYAHCNIICVHSLKNGADGAS